jgi:hypothetical protein
MPEYKMDSRSGRTAVLPTWCFDIGPRTRAFLVERGFELHRVEREGEWYRLKQPFQLIVQGDPPYALVRQGEAFVDAGLIDAVREREERAGRGIRAAAAWNDADAGSGGTPLLKADFTDAYSIHLPEPLDALEAARRMVSKRPRWVDGLLVLRNLAVTPFGLKRGASAGTERIGIFPVVSASPERVVMGFDDAHLDFRVVVEVAPEGRGQRVTASTFVRTRNRLGRLYLAAVRPFHRVIVPAMLAQIGRK